MSLKPKQMITYLLEKSQLTSIGAHIRKSEFIILHLTISLLWVLGISHCSLLGIPVQHIRVPLTLVRFLSDIYHLYMALKMWNKEHLSCRYDTCGWNPGCQDGVGCNEVQFLNCKYILLRQSFGQCNYHPGLIRRTLALLMRKQLSCSGPSVHTWQKRFVPITIW